MGSGRPAASKRELFLQKIFYKRSVLWVLGGLRPLKGNYFYRKSSISAVSMGSRRPAASKRELFLQKIFYKRSVRMGSGRPAASKRELFLQKIFYKRSVHGFQEACGLLKGNYFYRKSSISVYIRVLGGPPSLQTPIVKDRWKSKFLFSKSVYLYGNKLFFHLKKQLHFGTK